MAGKCIFVILGGGGGNIAPAGHFQIYIRCGFWSDKKLSLSPNQREVEVQIDPLYFSCVFSNGKQLFTYSFLDFFDCPNSCGHLKLSKYENSRKRSWVSRYVATNMMSKHEHVPVELFTLYWRT